MFLEMMAQGHQDAIAMLTNREGQLSSPVRDLVTNLLPTLRQHESMATDLQRSATEQNGLDPARPVTSMPADNASFPAAIGRSAADLL
jgi:uncharacterized protein (DUF305 family)